MIYPYTIKKEYYTQITTHTRMNNTCIFPFLTLPNPRWCLTLTTNLTINHSSCSVAQGMIFFFEETRVVYSFVKVCMV